MEPRGEVTVHENREPNNLCIVVLTVLWHLPHSHSHSSPNAAKVIVASQPLPLLSRPQVTVFCPPEWHRSVACHLDYLPVVLKGKPTQLHSDHQLSRQPNLELISLLEFYRTGIIPPHHKEANRHSCRIRLQFNMLQWCFQCVFLLHVLWVFTSTCNFMRKFVKLPASYPSGVEPVAFKLTGWLMNWSIVGSV